MGVGTVNQYLVTLSVDGTYVGVLDDQSGGALDSMEKKFRPGGMGAEESTGGPTVIENITGTHGFDRVRDSETVRFLLSRVGKGRATVIKQPLDADKHPWGRPYVYGGVFKKFALADSKADSNDVDSYTIEVSTDGTIG